MNTKNYLFTILFLLTCLSINAQSNNNTKDLDISNLNKIYSLNIPWNFTVDNSNWYSVTPTNAWQVQDPELSTYYGTGEYQIPLKFSNLNVKSNFAVFLPLSYGSEELFINDILIHKNSSYFGSKPEIIKIDKNLINAGNNELKIEINSFSSWGGFSGIIEIGSYKQVQEKWVRFVIKNSAISLVSLFLAIYFLIMFLYRKNEKYYIYFSGLSLSVSMFILGFYGLSLYLFNQAWAYWLVTFIGGIGMYMFPILFLHSFYGLKKKLVSKIFIVFYLFLMLFIIMEFLITGQIFYFNKYLYMGFNLSYIFVVIYLIVFSINTVRNKLIYSKELLVGISLLTLSFVFSMLAFTNIISIPPIIGEGFFLMVIAFSIVLAKRFAQTHVDLEEAYYNNLILNKNLENKVLERTKELADKNREIMESIEYAALIQNSILPSHDSMQEVFKDFYVSWKPKSIVGGDFYWLFQKNNGFIVGVIDCTGHGVPGALLTMTAKSLLESVVTHVNSDDPGKILSSLNSYLKKILSQENPFDIKDDGLDIGLCVYNGDNKLLFSGSRIRLHVYEDEDIVEYSGDRQGVGYKRSKMDYNYKTHMINLKPGMSFHMTTDGFLEQNGGTKGFSFGWTNYRKVLRQIMTKPMNEQLSYIEEALKEFQGTNEQRDDITLLGFKIKD